MRYYFHIRSPDHLDRDDEGVELPSAEAARCEARKAAREIVAELILQDERIDGMSFDIVDDTGRLLERVKFRDMIRLN